MASNDPFPLSAVQARLRHQMRALFGTGPAVLPFAAGLATQRPFLSPLGLHLPATLRASAGRRALETYAAAANHAAAHLRHAATPMPRSGLKPIQQVIYGVLQDARVEGLAIAEMPGLRAQWLDFHAAGPEQGNTFVVLLLRLARALLDPGYRDPHPWVAKAVRLHGESCAATQDPQGPSCQALRELSSLLGNDIGQMRLAFDARSYQVEPAYRDDNAHLWLPDSASDAPPAPAVIDLQLPRDTGAREGTASARPGETAATGGAEAGDAGACDTGRIFHYAEWDRLIGRSRRDWCAVREAIPLAADAVELHALPVRQAALLAALDRRLRAARLPRCQGGRAQPEGAELDLEAAVRARVDWRAGGLLSERVYQGRHPQAGAGSCLFLLDSSASTGAQVSAGRHSVLALSRDAAVLAALALERLGERCAIHGFSSSGRHDIRIEVCKDFAATIDQDCLGRLAALRSARSTRIGAALRHATGLLRAQPGAWRVGILVTDGAPHDIDIHDPDYLLEDAMHAVRDAARQGVRLLGVGLDDAAEPALRRMFGVRGYRVLGALEDLPQVLAGLHTQIRAG